MGVALGGDFGLGILAAGSPGSVTADCGTAAETDEIEATVSAGGSSLQYDATNSSYSYVWKTEKSWTGTCWRFTLTLDDGTIYTALFRFR
jgi:hypothetical protein